MAAFRKRNFEQSGMGAESDELPPASNDVNLKAFPMFDTYPRDTTVYRSQYITVPTTSDIDSSSTLLFMVQSDNTTAAWYDLQNSYVECTFSSSGDTGKQLFPFFTSLLMFKSCIMSLNGQDVSSNADRSNCHMQSLADICLKYPQISGSIDNQNITNSSLDMMETLIRTPPYLPADVYTWASTAGPAEGHRAKVDNQGGNFTLKYKPSCPLFNQPHLVPSNINMQLILNKFAADWSMMTNGTTWIPKIQSIVLKLKRVLLTNEAVALQSNLLREAQIGGLLKYKVSVARTTPFFVNVGATSFQLQLQNINAPSAIMLWFVPREQTVVGDRDRNIHPLSTGSVATALCSIKEMYCDVGSMRFPKDRFITRNPAGTGLWGGSASEDYMEYVEMCGRGLESPPFLSRDGLESGQFQVHFINLSNGDVVGMEPLEQIGGSLVVNATLHSPVTQGVTIYLTEIRNTSLHINTHTSQITKGW